MATNSVMVFSKTTCPFCHKIKKMFEDKKVKIEVLELDQIGELQIKPVVGQVWLSY